MKQLFGLEGKGSNSGHLQPSGVMGVNFINILQEGFALLDLYWSHLLQKGSKLIKNNHLISFTMVKSNFLIRTANYSILGQIILLDLTKCDGDILETSLRFKHIECTRDCGPHTCTHYYKFFYTLLFACPNHNFKM